VTEQPLDGLGASGRAAVALAREEADRLGHTFVGSEHLLLVNQTGRSVRS
jgi:hypothetical protein